MGNEGGQRGWERKVDNRDCEGVGLGIWRYLGRDEAGGGGDVETMKSDVSIELVIWCI